MKLRIARKVAKRSGHRRYQFISRPNPYNPEQLRRAALRLHRNWWTHTIRGGDSTAETARDWRAATRLAARERRRRNILRNQAHRAADMPIKRLPRRAGFWPRHPWPPDGVRAAFALRGEPWLPSWLEGP